MVCQFSDNVVSELMNIYAQYCTANLFIIGPSQLTRTKRGLYRYKQNDVISVYKMTVTIIGPVVISSNHAYTLMQLQNCHVTLYSNITYKLNNCEVVILLKSTCIKVMEHATITLLKNRYEIKLIDYFYNHSLNPQCLFQFVTLRNTTAVSPVQYSVNIIDNVYFVHKLLQIIPKEVCLSPYHHFTPHCKWIPTAAFHGYSPKNIYQQIMKISNKNITYHKICRCTHNGRINCSIDILLEGYTYLPNNNL